MTTELKHEIREFSVKETAAEMRKALRAAFPTVKFSVTMARGTAYGWIDYGWTDGPRVGQVEPIVHRFQDAYFDGMDDGYHRIEPTLYARPDGSLYEPRYSCRGANWSREFSPETLAWAEAIAVRGSYWWPEDVEPWRDNIHYATRGLLAGLDLTNGLPNNPREVFVERWQS